MKNTLKKTLVLVVFTLFLTGTTVVYAESSDRRGEFRSEEMKAKWKEKREKMHKELGLSDDQKAQLKTHREGNKNKMKAFHEQIKGKKQALKDELQKKEVDEAKVKSIHAEIKALKNKKADQRLDSIMGVRSILTPEQFKKFTEMKKDGRKNGKRHKFQD